MNEEDLKKLRQSFSNPFREDLPKPKKNKFGHTILTEYLPDEDPVDIEVEVDSAGVINANPTQALIDSPHITKMLENYGKSDQIEPVCNDIESTPSEPTIKPNRVNLAALLSELDEMDGTTERKQSVNNDMRDCLNKDCLYALPKDAKFCLKCGTPQMSKFCTECGYNFPGMEKFCPDCGTKR
jgi:RNA polymerase subunit RPABC4/transcription elongation factor Spt4